jgi:hypothetical protein
MIRGSLASRRCRRPSRRARRAVSNSRRLLPPREQRKRLPLLVSSGGGWPDSRLQAAGVAETTSERVQRRGGAKRKRGPRRWRGGARGRAWGMSETGAGKAFSSGPRLARALLRGGA